MRHRLSEVLFSLMEGYIDVLAWAKRPDVFSFTALPLMLEIVEIHGRPCPRLLRSSDTPYAGFFVRISEVNSNQGNELV